MEQQQTLPGEVQKENEPAVETLSEEQLNKGIETGTIPPAPSSDATPAPQATTQPKTEEQKAEGDTPAPAVEPATAAEKNPDGTPKTASSPEASKPEKLYAGKYKTLDELKKALLEVGKPLNYNAKFLEGMIRLAEKTNDWTTLEETYQELKLALDRNQKADADRKVAEEKARVESETHSPEDTELVLQQNAQIGQVVYEEALRGIDNNAIVQKMRSLGIAHPKNQQEFEKFSEDYPFLAVKYEALLLGKIQSLMKEAKEYQTAIEGQGTHNAAAKESAKQQIGEFVKRYELPVDDAAVEAIIAEAEKSAFANEMKAGVPYLREGGIFKYFLAERFPELEKAIKLKAEATGRTQAVDDLKEMKEKTTSTISTVPVPGTHSTETRKPDLENDADVSALSDDQLEKLLAGKT